MAKYNLKWEATDAQLLEALLLATGGEGGASLQDVLLMADAIYGTVFTLQELQQGLEKLVAVNYLAVQKNKLALTPLFQKEYESIVEQEPAGEESDALLQLLQQKELTIDNLENASQQSLKKYKLKNYYQQYLEQFG